MTPIRVVLFPTDFSERSAAAFHFACSLAAHYSARLVILHVQEVRNIGELVVPLLSDIESELRQIEEKLRAVQPSNPAFAVEHHLLRGVPAEQIVLASQRLGADVIVMGTHGRGGLRRALMGSVAAEVVRKALCAVLAVKMPKQASSVGPKRRDKQPAAK